MTRKMGYTSQDEPHVAVCWVVWAEGERGKGARLLYEERHSLEEARKFAQELNQDGFQAAVVSDGFLTEGAPLFLDDYRDT